MAKIKKQDTEGKFYVQSINRALTIVDELSKASHGLSLSEIAEKIDLPVSTVYRIVQNLVAWDYIRERDDGNYVLGFTLLALGNKVQDNLEIRNIAQKYMEQLNRETKETIYLAVLDKKNGEIIYVDKMESLRNIKLAASVGTRNYIHSTANGKCLVSRLSDEKIKELLSIKGMTALTEKTITSLPKFLEEIRKVRQNGYAVDDLENEPGVRCVAAPIIDYNKNVVAALSISGVESNISMESIEQVYSKLVKEAALKISQQLGYRPD
ncbi:helix-turn-helix domain-containing protein [Thermanaerosceptrum fracticalcis]|uniref:Helix-turn-helix domain-containing protein n=1 Tax=Thermanaerosceptrum fracticalcis TaxID=1712410 RepID=A0A7G6E373_THEFR|nr:IclR family transcriptional regulator [Thermanaerosceptrum fracticalcis]QNB46527.1 helix-turn-helix domain-containing protein [Thermanaerosceptrum fracticalcis]